MARAQGEAAGPASATASWEAFYLIIGSSGAVLTGLLFVVIALPVDRATYEPRAIRAFATPTVAHFAAVLVVSAIASMPHPAGVPVGALFAACGVVGIAYLGLTARQARNLDSYKPVPADWLWHFLLPVVAYGVLVMAGLRLSAAEDAALYGIGGGALLLLLVGIHNAWDAAVYIAVERVGQDTKPSA